MFKFGCRQGTLVDKIVDTYFVVALLGHSVDVCRWINQSTCSLVFLKGLLAKSSCTIVDGNVQQRSLQGFFKIVRDALKRLVQRLCSSMSRVELPHANLCLGDG